MADPEAAMLAFLQGIAAQLPTGTTYSTSFPDTVIKKEATTAPHIQFAWDGTPSDADNREDTAVRFTVWAPKGKRSQAKQVAGTVRALVLAYSGAGVFRVDRGAGRLPGVDDATELPFCTFTVNPVMHALTA